MTDLQWAQLSDGLLSWAMVVFALAMVGYAVEHAFGRRTAVAGTVAARALATVGGGPAEEERLAGRQSDPGPRLPAMAGRGAVVLTAVGLVMVGVAVLARGLAADRVPWGNMYEFAVATAFVGGVVWLVVLWRGGPTLRRLGGFVVLPILLLLGLATLVLYVPAGPLMPALDSSWLQIHVSAAILATGTFLVAFVASVLALVRGRHDRLLAAGRRPGGLTAAARRLPDTERLETVAARVTVFGFPIWTFAIVAGAIWAESAWGRYWGWDPKETWSAISWLMYAGYLHARSTAGWSGRRSSWIQVAAFVTVMINLFGVNFVVTGLHTYA